MKKFLERYWYVIVTCLVLVISISGAIACVVLLGNTADVNTTSIGYISYLNDKDERKIKTDLSTKIETWKNSTNYTIEFQGIKYKIENLDIIDFDVDKTYSLAPKNTQNNKAYFTSNAENVTILEGNLNQTFGTAIINDFDDELFVAAVVEIAKNLTRTYEFKLTDFLEDGANLKTNDTWSTKFENLDPSDVAALEGKEIVINSGYFSLLDEYKKNYDPIVVDGVSTPNKQDLSFLADDPTRLSERLSIIASAMAKVIQTTSFQAIKKTQKHPFGVPYATGRTSDILVYVTDSNSALDLNKLDFTFVNPENYEFTFKMEYKSETELEFRLYGYQYSSIYEVVTRNKTLAYKTLGKDLSLDAGFNALSDEEKSAYYSQEGYELMDFVTFAKKYKAIVFPGENVTDEEIDAEASAMANMAVWVKVTTEGINGTQVDYYRKTELPDGSTSISNATIYTSPDVFYATDEIVSYYVVERGEI